jgi:hypothetical protein
VLAVRACLMNALPHYSSFYIGAFPIGFNEGVLTASTYGCSFGPTLHLTSSAIEAMFPRAFERIGVGFYRSKITSWMAAQEEDYRRVLF